MKTTTNTAAAAARNIAISFRPFVKVATNKAARKLADDNAIAQVNRAVTRWFYS